MFLVCVRQFAVSRNLLFPPSHHSHYLCKWQGCPGFAFAFRSALVLAVRRFRRSPLYLWTGVVAVRRCFCLPLGCVRSSIVGVTPFSLCDLAFQRLMFTLNGLSIALDGALFHAFGSVSATGRCSRYLVDWYCVCNAAPIDGHCMLLNANIAKWCICPCYALVAYCFVRRFRIVPIHLECWPIETYYLVRIEDQFLADAFFVNVSFGSFVVILRDALVDPHLFECPRLGWSATLLP